MFRVHCTVYLRAVPDSGSIGKTSLAAGPVVTLNAVYVLPPRRREAFCSVCFVSGGGSGKHGRCTFQTPSYWHEEHVCFHEEAMSVM